MPQDEAEIGFLIATEDARGWPVLALCSDTMLTQTPSGEFVWRTHGGIPLSGEPLSGSDRVTLPLRPIWLGFAADVAAYGGLAFTLLFGRGILRHWMWRARGRCAQCGYSLRGLTSGRCPECGAEIERDRGSGGESAAR